MISDKNRNVLQAAGLKIVENDGDISIVKPLGVAGNELPFKRPYKINYGEENIDTDFPVISLQKKDGKLTAIYWEWVPGPGPGDFRIDFDNEDEIVSFIKDYYFNPDNKYFKALRDYEIQSRNSINVNDIRAIFDKLLQRLDSEFSNSEIIFGERGNYNKIPPESWRITKYQGEETIVNTKTGFLNVDVAKLRGKLYEKTEFDFEDINNISALVFELSLLIRDK